MNEQLEIPFDIIESNKELKKVLNSIFKAAYSEFKKENTWRHGKPLCFCVNEVLFAVLSKYPRISSRDAQIYAKFLIQMFLDGRSVFEWCDIKEHEIKELRETVLLLLIQITK